NRRASWRRWGYSLLAATCMLLSTVLTAVAAQGRVVLRDCRGGGSAPTAVRPVHIGCGAVGAPDFRRLHWRSWGRAQAVASGLLTYRYCPPAPCDDPRNYYTARARVRVYRIRSCDGQRAYTRLQATYADNRHRRRTFDLSRELHWSSCS